MQVPVKTDSSKQGFNDFFEKRMIVFRKNEISWARNILLRHVVYVLETSQNFKANGDPNFTSTFIFISQFFVGIFSQYWRI